MLPPLIIVQARMGSSRFPGKTLAKFSGREALGHLIDALLQVSARDGIIVATSREQADNAVEDFCKQEKVAVFRGDEKNVALRFFEILQAQKPKSFARISGDSPLFDPTTLQQAIRLFQSGDFDLVSTALECPYPSGFNVEILKASTFVESFPKFSTSEHFEHVTKYFYEHADKFQLASLPCPIENARNWKFSFDDASDLHRLEQLFAELKKPHYQYALAEKIDLMKHLSPSADK